MKDLNLSSVSSHFPSLFVRIACLVIGCAEARDSLVITSVFALPPVRAVAIICLLLSPSHPSVAPSSWSLSPFLIITPPQHHYNTIIIIFIITTFVIIINIII